ncbi:MAG: ATP-binding cassette domain-containing protein [Magnetococcales bacterium]|nr:ATP-binding cassette domain-containing protein [Magnetococcales bacterium]
MIQISGVQKRFQRQAVLDGVNLSIQAGDRIALIGSNGAGKTSLIRCILGEYSFSGKLTVNGLDPRKQRVAVLNQVGFVPQLPPPLKVRVAELVALTAQLMQVPKMDIHRVAEGLGLDLTRHQKQIFFKLSGGMKQKLLIAIALARNPKILILDEPAANLDPEARSTFFAQLAEMAQETVMLLSSHRVDEISGLVNRVVEMDQGLVVVDQSFTEHLTKKV